MASVSLKYARTCNGRCPYSSVIGMLNTAFLGPVSSNSNNSILRTSIIFFFDFLLNGSWAWICRRTCWRACRSGWFSIFWINSRPLVPCACFTTECGNLGIWKSTFTVCSWLESSQLTTNLSVLSRSVSSLTLNVSFVRQERFWQPSGTFSVLVSTTNGDPYCLQMHVFAPILFVSKMFWFYHSTSEIVFCKLVTFETNVFISIMFHNQNLATIWISSWYISFSNYGPNDIVSGIFKFLAWGLPFIITYSKLRGPMFVQWNFDWPLFLARDVLICNRPCLHYNKYDEKHASQSALESVSIQNSTLPTSWIIVFVVELNGL